MKKLLIAIMFLLLSSSTANAMWLSDRDGHILDITPQGKFNLDALSFGEIDAVTGYLINIGMLHHKRHEGKLFRYIHKLSLTTGSHDMVFTVGASPARMHFAGFISGDEKVEAILYEAPTGTTGGTEDASNIFNVDRSSTNTQTLVTSLLNEPTVTTPGRLLDGSFADKNVVTRNNGEIILKPNTTYLVRFTFDKQTVNAYMGFEYYEQIPGGS